jgi:fructoselysine-6-P-deglycase FrlB-like protein
MTYVAEEIASQPGCWRRALSLAARTDGLPDPGERVAVVGCGTSLYMAQAYAALRERAGHRRSPRAATTGSSRSAGPAPRARWSPRWPGEDGLPRW